MRAKTKRCRGNRGERGAILLLSAMAMVAIVIVAAIVVDLGQLRSTRRDVQTVTDLAALAAGFYLSGHGSSTATADPSAACAAALDSVRANVKGLPAATVLDCAALPASATAPSCTESTASQTITASSSSPYVLSVQYPVPAYDIVDARYQSGVGLLDGTSRCQRMKVSLSRTNGVVFAGIVGVSSLRAGASTVVRSSVASTGAGAAALLLLERVGCAALQTSGGGSQGAGVVVQSVGANPGVIHSDSAGVVSATAPTSCSSNENSSGYAVYGTSLPAAGGGGPSITAQSAVGGASGVIGIRALAVSGRGGAVANTGISPAPVVGGVMSRSPADTKYNQPSASGGTAQIESLHTAGYKRATMTALAATTAGYRVLSGSDCAGLDTASTPVIETAVFVNCPTFTVTGTTVFPNATTVIFAGKVSVPNNTVLSLPVVRAIDIRGCTISCSGGGNFALSVSGTLWLNNGGTGATAAPCSTRAGPGAAGTTTNWTQLATFGGPLLVTGSISMCQTFAYIGQENQPTYSRRTQTANGAAPENYPAIAGCSTASPCPSNTGGQGYVSISGGSGSADWSAPNQLNIQPTAADFATNPFEAIALWSESHVNSSLKGQGTNRTEGVFFTPNSAMTFSGQASQTQPLNAQFISRSLNISGQGSLNLKPNPNDSIITPIAGTSALIR